MPDITPAFRARMLETTFRRGIAAQMDNPEHIERYLMTALQEAASQRGLCALRKVLDDHLVDMLHREEDIERWQAMLLHESKRERFCKLETELKQLKEEIGHWWEWLNDATATHPNHDPVVLEIEMELQRNDLKALNVQERQRIGRHAFCAAILRLHREKRA